MFNQPTEPTSPHPLSRVALAVGGVIEAKAREASRRAFVAMLAESFAQVAREYDLNPVLLAQVAAKETAL